ncbi:PQQ-binding-like beta-propeller repeat protein [Longibacter salinarum]|nr:PQQ-binding-like beta-propeller repeat protein [Longibacter salinarum]
MLLLLTGCGSSMQSTVPQEWSMSTEDVDAVRATPTGEIVARQQKDAWVMDDTGQLIYDAREKKGLGGMLKQSFKESTTFAGFSLADFDGEQLTTVAMPSSNVLMVFDNREGSDEIRSVDLRDGSVLWETSEFDWSLSEQKAIGDAATKRLAAALSDENTTVEGGELFNRYAQSLAAEVPAIDGVLIKVNNGLVLTDPSTGDIRWRADGVTGTGIAAVHYLPEQDELLLATDQTDLAQWSEDAQRVIRLDATSGDVVWSSPYGARVAPPVRGIRVFDDAVMIDMDTGGTEAYRLSDGSQLFKSSATTRSTDRMATALGGESTIGGRLTASAAVHDGTAYVPHTTNFKAVGRPDKMIQAYDLATGEMTWESEPIEEAVDVRGLRFVDGRLVAHIVKDSAGGDQVVASWDASTGELAWTRGLSSGHVLLTSATVHAVTDSSHSTIDLDTGEFGDVTNLGQKSLGNALAAMPAGDGLAVLRESGITWMSADGTVSESMNLGGTIVRGLYPSEERVGDRLFVPVSTKRIGSAVTEVHVIDMAERTERAIIRNLSFSSNGSTVSTNFPFGFFVTNNGASLYVLDKDDRVVYYRIPDGAVATPAP